MTEFDKLVLDSLDYDPIKGTLVWKVDMSRKVRAGHDAGCVNGRKMTVTLKGTTKPAHHIAWFIYNRKWPAQYLKAHDGDLTNLKIENLFEQTVSESVSANKKGKRSGTPGVTWSSKQGRWQAHITRSYKAVFLGYFENKDDAIAARRAAEGLGGYEQSPERIEQIKLSSRQRIIWKRMTQHCGGFTVWLDFQEFAAWVNGEPKGWTLVAEDPSKPVGPNNVKWLDKPENKYDRNCKESMKTYRKERREAKPDMYRGHALKRDYGMTVADYARMLEEQNGVCAICGKPETHVKHGKISMLAVDHCHVSEKVRGLLCVRCNLLIGYAKDDISTLERAIRYLKEHKE